MRLLLLVHGGGFDSLHRAVSCAAAAVSGGDRVDLVLFGGALHKFVEGRFDEVSLDPADARREGELQQKLDELEIVLPGRMLEAARADHALSVFACSASAAMEGLDPERLRAQVDEVVGWPTVLQWMRQADHVLQF